MFISAVNWIGVPRGVITLVSKKLVLAVTIREELDTNIITSVPSEHLDRCCDLLVIVLNNVDGIYSISCHDVYISFIDFFVPLDDCKDDDVVAQLHHTADVGDAGIVQQLANSVLTRSIAGIIEVTSSTIWSQNTHQLTIKARIMIFLVLFRSPSLSP